MLHPYATDHSRAALLLSAAAAFLFTVQPACSDDKEDPPKGVVDESAPPGSPLAGPPTEGKADGSGAVVAVSLESAHPYVNNFARTYRLDLAGKVPACATRARVRFAALRTEPGYDYVHLLAPGGARVQSLDGNRDGTWSAWVDLEPVAKYVDVQLVTDYSITQYGFRIDAADYETGETRVICPLRPIQPCPDGTVDLAAAPGVCECPPAPLCAALGGVEIAHAVGGGFTGVATGHRTVGTEAFKTRSSPADGSSATRVGTVDAESLATLIYDFARSGLLDGAGRSEPSNWSESFTVTAGGRTVSFVAPAGSHGADVAGFISRFRELTSCGDLGDLTCQEGFACDGAGECVADEGCMCIALYQPVCGVNGATYGNACEAGCADAAVKHDGACGIAGDACGTIRGLTCLDDFKCRYGASAWTPPYPDAGGQCVGRSYCDAPGDCVALPHIAVPGSWACEANACRWKTGPTWSAFGGFSYVSARPYANNVSEWRELYLPEGATKMRLVASGIFALEEGYDKLEVWAWRSGAWAKVKTYTGTVGPQLGDVFGGRYFYLHFVTDSSITDQGFSLTAQWSTQ